MNIEVKNTIKAIAFHIPFAVCFFYWIKTYYPIVLGQFVSTYESFGMRVPESTKLAIEFFSNLSASVLIVTTLSVLPAFFLKNKSKYIGIGIPILFILGSILFLYIPGILHGPVV